MENSNIISTDLANRINDSVDRLEATLAQGEQTRCPLLHIFTPGLYSRTIFMPAHTLIVSKKHKTRHQFILSKGKAMVRVNDDQWEEIIAPWVGVTEPGTRRVLLIGEDCVWTTVHATDIVPEDDSIEARVMAAAQVEEIIIEKYQNPYLNTVNPNPCHLSQPGEQSLEPE